MSANDFNQTLGKTKRQLYRKWVSERKFPADRDDAVVQYYLPPYRDCTKQFISQ